MDQSFRGPQASKIAGITYRQLDWWARKGVMSPSIVSAKGSGTPRRYSYGDVLKLKVLKLLTDAGLSPPSAGKAVECLGPGLDGDVGSANLVITPCGSVLAHSGDEIIDVLSSGPGVLSLISLSGVVSEVDAAITELRRAMDSDGGGPIDLPRTAFIS